MASEITGKSRGRGALRLRFAALLYLGTAYCAGHAASGAARVDPYQASVAVPERSESALATAFQTAMKTVLVRVTGRRTTEDDAGLAPLISNARRYVQQYRATPDGQIWAAFDAPAIDRWLTQNGRPVWGRERPTTFVWLAVPGGADGTLISAADGSDLKTAIEAAALQRGIPLLWPSSADVQRLGASATGSNPTLIDVAHRAGADAVLIGRAAKNSADAGVRWTLVFQDRSNEFSGALEGVNRAADLYAGMFAASGTLGPVEIEVDGIGDLRQYAAVQSDLESLSFVSHVTVQELSKDTVRFRLMTRGGAEGLRRALTLNGRLHSLPAGDAGIQRFQIIR